MMHHRDAALKIEQLHNNEDTGLHIKSKIEMQSILQNIAEHGTHVALYYDGDQNFILTVLLGTDEQGMWLDIGPSPPDNKRLLLCDKITFVSLHQHVKIQFEGYGIKSAMFRNSEAFYMELPDYLLRIQRRDFFRIDIPAAPPVKCMISIPPGEPGDPAIRRAFPVLDLSGSGIGLLCEDHDAMLLPDKVFPNCQISLPGVGILTVSIKVRNNIKFTSANNVANMRAGCSFERLDNQTNIELNSYITRLQRENLARVY